MTKYSVPDDYWDRKDEPADEYSPTTVDSHNVDVILTTDPTETMGYGREKYTAHIVHDDEGVRVLYFTKHRWKGNYWRDVRDLDWLDVPGSVRQQVAAVVACDGVDDLDPGVRVIGEGGRSTWRQCARGEDDAGD